jgi:(1->4)-alpha-D-glucan 1-alpha-D-glucosylmutase
VGGARAGHLLAFARRQQQQLAIVLAPRLYRRIAQGETTLPLGAGLWADTHIELPTELAGTALINVFDGAAIPVHASADRCSLRAADAFANFPVALLTSGAPTPAAA